MRAKEFTDHRVMAKIEKTGQIVQILRHKDEVKFSDDQGWFLVNTEPGRRTGTGVKWIPDSTRFAWVKNFKSLKESKTATARQVLDYINRTHHEPFQPREKMYKAVMAHPRWELQRVPLLNLNLPDQEYDDVDYYDNPPESDPYGRTMLVDPGHAGEVSQHLIDKNPIVIDADRYIIDGNHRAWAAKYLLNRQYINAWVPATQNIAEAFDRPYPLTWEKSEADDSMDALARLPDGSNLSIMFNQDYDDEGEGIYSVEFWRGNSQEITGAGDSQRVFATLLAAIAEFIKKRRPKQLYFSANKDVEPGQKAGSRSNLYTSLVRRYAHALGYEADVSDFAGSTTYKLYQLNENDEDSQQYLYHATYRPLLKSIKSKGLGNTTQSQWTDSQPGVVYLARDPEVARSYAEAAESVPEEWLDQIVVLQISKSKLNPKLLHTDRNVQDNPGDTLEYHAVIPAKLLSVNKLNEVNYPDELTVSDRIQEYFYKRGYELAGEGRDQMAFESPRGTILKVLGIGEDEREQVVRRYVKFFEKNQRNQFYPRIFNSGDFTVDGETYFVYEMERVNYVANEEATLDYIEKLMSAVDRGQGAEYVRANPVPDEIGQKQLAGLLQATEHMMRALGGTAPLDLSAVENLGRRDNGHLVIVDPYSL